MIRQYFFLSLNNLRKRKLRSWLTMLGVIIGIAAVISLIGLGEGLSNFVTAQFSTIDTDVITVQAAGLSSGPPGSGVVNPLTKDDLEAIRDVKGVKTAVGRILHTGFFEYNGISEITFYISVPDGEYRKDTYDFGNYDIDEGRLLKDGDAHKVVLGWEFRDEETYDKEIRVGSEAEIGGIDHEVIGFLERKGSFTQDAAILMNEEDMRELFDIDDEKYDIIAVRPDASQDVGDVKLVIERELRDVRDVDLGEEDFTVETREQALENLNDTLFGIQLFVYIIAGISIVVGGIGIMNTMYTAVLERTKDIGIMKAVGARNKDIFGLFFIESGLIGMVGGIIGIMLGAAFAYFLAFLAGNALQQDMIQAHISPMLVLGALAFSYIVGTLAGVLPAIGASKLNPVKALSYAK